MPYPLHVSSIVACLAICFGFSIQGESHRHIGHPEGAVIGHVANLVIGQLTNVLLSAWRGSREVRQRSLPLGFTARAGRDSVLGLLSLVWKSPSGGVSQWWVAALRGLFFSIISNPNMTLLSLSEVPIGSLPAVEE